MQIFISASFILVVIAIVLFFRISSKDIMVAVTMFETKNKKTLKDLMKKKENPIIKFLKDTEDMLERTGQKNRLTMILTISVLLIVVGISLAFTIGNIFLAPVCGLAFGVLPFLYIRFQFMSYNKLVVEELVKAMSMITTSYERTENIILAFKENADETGEPIKGILKQFIFELENVDPNIERALDILKEKIDHSVWIEWCEAFKRCSRDRSLKFILAPTVTKLTKIKVAAGEVQNILMKATRDFWAMLIANIGLLFVGVYILPSGLMVEIPEDLANGLVALNLACMVFTSIKISIQSREIKFDL